MQAWHGRSVSGMAESGEARRVFARHGKAGSFRLGAARRDPARRGVEWSSEAGMARFDMAVQSDAVFGDAGAARRRMFSSGGVRSVRARRGDAGMAGCRCGGVRSGMVGQGTARRGRHGSARLGTAWHWLKARQRRGRQSETRRDVGLVRPGSFRQGESGLALQAWRSAQCGFRRGSARFGLAVPIRSRQARKGIASSGRSSFGTARQGRRSTVGSGMAKHSTVLRCQVWQGKAG
jgi:hypothetical protein